MPGRAPSLLLLTHTATPKPPPYSCRPHAVCTPGTHASVRGVVWWPICVSAQRAATHWRARRTRRASSARRASQRRQAPRSPSPLAQRRCQPRARGVAQRTPSPRRNRSAWRVRHARPYGRAPGRCWPPGGPGRGERGRRDRPSTAGGKWRRYARGAPRARRSMKWGTAQASIGAAALGPRRTADQ
eukprot:scaffold5545_cov111-Isochrysis_galbana.AAC.8